MMEYRDDNLKSIRNRSNRREILNRKVDLVNGTNISHDRLKSYEVDKLAKENPNIERFRSKYRIQGMGSCKGLVNNNYLKSNRYNSRNGISIKRFIRHGARRTRKKLRRKVTETLVSDHDFGKNTTANTSVNAALATKNAVKSFKNTMKNIKRALRIISFILKSPILIKVGVVAAVLLIIAVIVGTVMAIILSFTNVSTDKAIILNYKNEIMRLDKEFIAKIDKLKETPGYDEYIVTYMNEDGMFKTSYQELIVYMSVKYNQNLTFSEDEKKSLYEIYNKTHYIETKSEKTSQAVPEPQTQKQKLQTQELQANDAAGQQSQPNPSDKNKLIIEVYTDSVNDKLVNLGFTRDQMSWYNLLLESDITKMYPELADAGNGLSSEEMKKMIQNAQRADVSRKELIDVAMTLLGRVSYYWGGKSTPGWNDNWGKLMLVTAVGSKATGTMQPYGLDCSGYVDWVYKTAGVGDMLSGGTTSQWNNTYPIQESELLPGDLVFKDPPNSYGINHVGIFSYRDASGVKQYIHCTSHGGVVVNHYEGFKYWRRAYVKFTEN